MSSPPDAEKKQFTLFLVPNEAKGYTRGEKYRKLGWRSSDTRPLYFDECQVDADNVVDAAAVAGNADHRGRRSLSSRRQQDVREHADAIAAVEHHLLPPVAGKRTSLQRRRSKRLAR